MDLLLRLAPQWFHWLHWAVLIGAVSFLADVTENTWLDAVVCISYVAMLGYFVAMLRSVLQRHFGMAKGKSKAWLLLALALSSLIVFGTFLLIAVVAKAAGANPVPH